MAFHVVQSRFQAEKAVLGFTGWPDAGGMVQQVFRELEALLPHQRITTWDMDGFWHTAGQRPHVTIRHGQVKQLQWPSYVFYGSGDAQPSRVLLGLGPEPCCLWRRFSNEMIERLESWGCREVVLLGSLYDQVFHDEVRVSAVVQDATGYNLAEDWGCLHNNYQGPSAVHSALHLAAAGGACTVLSLWSHLPFYLRDAPEPVLVRILEILGKFLGREWNLQHLKDRWESRLQDIEALLEQDPNLQQKLEAIRIEKASADPALDSPKVIRLDDFLKKKSNTDPEGGDA